MEGPPIISASNPVEPPKHILQQLMEHKCVTWHPDFERKNYDKFMDIIHKFVPYEDLNDDNKWGYQFKITKQLKDIPVDFSDIISVKNMIVMDNFRVSMNNNGNYIYSTRSPISVYEIFLKYCSKYNKNIDKWEDDSIEDLRNLHAEKKKNYCQYTFFSTDEEGIGYFANSIIYLATS